MIYLLRTYKIETMMITRLRNFIFIFMIVIASCNNSNNSKLTFVDNIETSYAFNSNHQLNIIKSSDAHSGSYVCKIDTFSAFSTTFTMRVSDITSGKLKSIHVSAWVKMESMKSEPLLVVNVLDSNKKSLEWLSKSVNEQIYSPNEWIEVNYDLSLMENDRNNSANYLIIYASNGRKEPVYIDDLYIAFDEE